MHILIYVYTYTHVYQHLLFLPLFHKHSSNTVTEHMHSLGCLAVALNRERREQSELIWQKISGAPNKINQERCTGKDQRSVIQGFLYSNEIKIKCPGVGSLCVLTVPLCSEMVYHCMVTLWTKNVSRKWTILLVLQSFLCTSCSWQGQYRQIVVEVPTSPKKEYGDFKVTRILTNIYLVFSSIDQVSYLVKYVYSQAWAVKSKSWGKRTCPTPYTKRVARQDQTSWLLSPKLELIPSDKVVSKLEKVQRTFFLQET